MTDEVPDVVVSNQHEYRFMPPDRCAFVLRGPFEEGDAAAYTQFIYQHADRLNTLLCATYDISKLTRLTDGARSHLMGVRRAFPLKRIALIGASFSTRMMATMVIRAGRMVAPDKWGFEYEFFPSPDEAETWLENPRSKRR
jgi:hypothetical protein